MADLELRRLIRETLMAKTDAEFERRKEELFDYINHKAFEQAMELAKRAGIEHEMRNAWAVLLGGSRPIETDQVIRDLEYYMNYPGKTKDA